MKEKEIESLKLKANLGDVVSQFRLGILYREGIDEFECPNHREAFFWLEKSARYGYDKAQVALGSMYLKKLIPKEKGEMVKYQDCAVYYFRLAAKQGNREAKDNLITLNVRELPLNVPQTIFYKNNGRKIYNSEEKKNFINRIRSNNLGTSPLSR